ncbi:HIT domain-containing protein [Paenibacillus oenotherae]|uniref:HIT domain-containing protein n=1 Tax=Paenibacillus oenotherae TaxID=1435645 RepID=A0ABS7D8U0_9BACL|nr:HIT domain-containing protein [Paenibacillus oenotherae]MBW7476357.1 HIT domain-containing protein [Paenibacillus oenotherae]
MDCIFCRIINREVSAEIIYEDEEVISFYGLHFSAPVHALVIPKKHIDSIMDIGEADGHIVFRLHLAFQTVARILGVENTGFRVITNTGVHGQQEVHHLHYHLIGGRQLEWEM